MKDQMFASVCLQSSGDEVSINFHPVSKKEQFIFDIEDFRSNILKGEYVKAQARDVNRRHMHHLVKSYLVHYGYVETL